MNWIARKEEDNTYTIFRQCVKSLKQGCITTLADSIKYSFTSYLDTHSSLELIKDSLTLVVKYFRSNLFKLESNQPILPYWISDNLLPHFLHDESVPDVVFNKLFSNTFCSLSEVEFKNLDKPYLLDRLSQVNTFNLTSLNLSYCDTITDSIFLSSSSSCMTKSLKTLKVRRCSNFKRISSLHGFVNLTNLDLSENNLNFEGMVPFAVLCSLVKSFPLLKSLDLHLTNLVLSFCEVYDRDVLSELHEQLLSEVKSNLQLQELILYTLVESEEFDLFQVKLFYSALSEFASLTHLDLSGWPALDKIPEVTISKLSKGLVFFGLYNTPLTRLNTSSIPHCSEISGFANEYQILSSIQHYVSVQEYMDVIYSDFFNAMLNKQISFSNDTVLKLLPLILESFDQEIYQIAHNNGSGILSDSTMILRSSACLYSILKKDLPSDIVTRVVTSCILLFNLVDMGIILDEGWSFLITNICLIYCSLFLIENPPKIQEEMNSITYEFLMRVIHKICDNSPMLLSNNHVYKLLYEIIRLFNILILPINSEQKSFIGQKFGSVNTLMKLVTVKFEQKKCDEHMTSAISAIMSLIYHSLPNCLELSQKVYSDLLVKIIEECSVDSSKLDVVDGIMGLIENIAEFCLKDTRASVSYQMISPVLAVLRYTHKYKQDAIASAISISAYYRVGAEMWKWKENGEEALSLAVQAIHQIDYKTPRGYFLDTLELLMECLKAKDDRVVLCAVWVICNLVYKQPENYIKMLDENSLLLIRSISNSYPKESQFYILSMEILHLNDITKICAEVSN